MEQPVQNKNFNIDNCFSKHDELYRMLNDFEYIPLRKIFFKKHQQIPNEITFSDRSMLEIKSFFLKHKKKSISTHLTSCGESLASAALFLGGKGNLYIYTISYDDKRSEITILFSKKTKKVLEYIEYFNSIAIKEENGGHLNILVKTQDGFDLERKKISCPDLDFDLNYNHDFKQIHELIIDKLSVDFSKGIVLLHGKAGTGKTTYIRYLINNLKKKVIYIPPNMTNVLSDPELIKFFITHSNCILVIEDAENVLMKRAVHSSQAIANILNLSDGLLSDCTNIQIVATFNTSLENIDEALLRKGRLIAKYEFTELEDSVTKKIAEKLGVNINGKHTLADIYGANEVEFTKTKKEIGF